MLRVIAKLLAERFVGEGLAPPETFHRIMPPIAEQIDLSVGYGIHDVPRMTGVFTIGSAR